MHQKALTLRIIGFVASLLLTLGAFLIIFRPDVFHLDARMAVLAIISLAVLQSIIQYICFLSLKREKGPRWNFGVFASTISIILIIILFSIWIMDRLDYNMMP